LVFVIAISDVGEIKTTLQTSQSAFLAKATIKQTLYSMIFNCLLPKSQCVFYFWYRRARNRRLLSLLVRAQVTTRVAFLENSGKTACMTVINPRGCGE